MPTKRKKYTEEFKRDAVRMMRKRGSRTVGEVAEDLGIHENQLHRWAAKLDDAAFAKRNRPVSRWRKRIVDCARRTSGSEWRRPS